MRKRQRGFSLEIFAGIAFLIALSLQAVELANQNDPHVVEQPPINVDYSTGLSDTSAYPSEGD